jgi:hypothetical protein
VPVGLAPGSEAAPCVAAMIRVITRMAVASAPGPAAAYYMIRFIRGGGQPLYAAAASLTRSAATGPGAAGGPAAGRCHGATQAGSTSSGGGLSRHAGWNDHDAAAAQAPGRADLCLRRSDCRTRTRSLTRRLLA